MNAVIAIVANANRSTSAEGPLHFEAPLLILRRMRFSIGNADARWEEEGIGLLDLCKGLAGGKSVDESGIRTGSNGEEVIPLIGSEAIAADRERVDEWRISGKGSAHAIGERIVENAPPATDHNGMRYPERLPGKAESRCPHNLIGALQSLL